MNKESMDNPTSRVMFITGAAGGIGFGLAHKFASAGYKVMLSDISADALDIRVNALKSKKFDVRGCVCDVTSEEDLRQAINLTVNAFGRLDLLINNAGLQHVAPLEDFPVEKFEKMLQVMLTGPFIATKLAIPVMKKNNYGRIINIASINGLVGFSGKAAYNSAKHGLVGLTKVTALEMASWNITANAICPGYIDTELVRGQLADIAQTRNISESRVLEEVILPLVPQKKLITVEEVADLAIYLSGDSARSLTGQTVVLDGGYTAQ